MAKERLYEFEGQMRTINEIMAMIPKYKKSNIYDYLNRGYKSRQEILGFEPEIVAKNKHSEAVKKNPWHGWRHSRKEANFKNA